MTHQRLRVGSKKHALSLPEGSVQQGCSRFYARSVRVVGEHGKMARTPLAAFFNRPMDEMGPDLNISVSLHISILTMGRAGSCNRECGLRSISGRPVLLSLRQLPAAPH